MSDALERLQAESDIRNIVARLGHLADDGDLAEYITLFTPDASWVMEGFDDVPTGRDALLAAASQRRADGVQGPGSGTRHLNTTLWVRIDSSEEAYAESYFVFIDTNTDPVEVKLTGRYRDSFRLTADGWKLHQRVINTSVN